MEVTCTWEDAEESVIRFAFYGKWTWTVCRNLVYQVFDHTHTTNQRIDCIVDMTHAGSLPIESDNQCIKETLESAPYNYGLTVLVGADRFTRLVISIVQQYTPIVDNKLILANNLEEAHALIDLSRAVANSR